MHIQCTKKMLIFLNPVITEINTDDDFFAWHADYISVGRKKLFVIMNDLTRFCIVLYGLKKSDFKDSIHIIKNAIYATMFEQGYELNLIHKYLDLITEITYNRTKNRNLVAQLNRAVTDASWCIDEGIFVDKFEQPQIAINLNESPVGTNNWKVTHFPYQKMHEYLKILS